MHSQPHHQELASYWKSILLHSERKKWVMFSHGSIVIFLDRLDTENHTLIQDARSIMAQDGPVIAGTPHMEIFQPLLLRIHNWVGWSLHIIQCWCL